MRILILSLTILSVTSFPSWAENVAACETRADVLSQQAQNFSGNARNKRLIDADLQRARKEAAEGDVDECTEALDHAAKLLAGDA